MTTVGSYSLLDRIVHSFVLGSTTIQRVSFDLERQYFDRAGSRDGCRNAVFVCGLARSGTTALLRLLYDTGEFESLTYRDMPFVLMPGVWNRVTKSLQKPPVAAERAHGDSIMVDFDSPEGFECVFWRTFEENSYDCGGCLHAYEPGDEVLDKFRTYVSMVAARSGGAPRPYLSKNNNNLIRLGAIQRALPDAAVLVLYRDPLQTAASSLRQHLRFCEAQRRDPFVLRYMNWLEHFEFGLNHKPLRFRDGDLPPIGQLDADYWLRYWVEVYGYLLDTDIPFRFLSYETLCGAPDTSLRQLFGCLGINADRGKYAHSLRLAQTTDLPGFDSDLIARARAVSERLYADRRNLVWAD